MTSIILGEKSETAAVNFFNTQVEGGYDDASSEAAQGEHF
jgi:hypothetical protein